MDKGTLTYDELVEAYITLQQENIALKDVINKKDEEINHSQHLIDLYMELLNDNRRKMFGASSEVIHDGRPNLFNLDEVKVNGDEMVIPAEELTETQATKPKNTKEKGKRARLFGNLETKDVEHDIPDTEKACGACGTPYIRVGRKELYDLLTWVPGYYIVEKHFQFVYKAVCDCESKKGETTFISAPAPKPITNSYVSPSTLAHVIYDKYALALPLYRQSEQLQNAGLDISRQTMANWVIKGSELWLSPVYDRLKYYLLQEEVVHADESKFQVLKEPGRPATSQSKIWLYCTGARNVHAIYLYEYTVSREGVHPQTFLSTFYGYLCVDGYKGYNAVLNAIIVNCWDHARRKFFEAVQVIPKAGQKNTNAYKGLEYCNRIAEIERELKNLSSEERYLQRYIRVSPILNEFFTWLDDIKDCVTNNKFGKAVKYSLDYEIGLLSFLLDGRLDVTNNRAERGIKPFVIGRKNWLFADSQAGARASAIAYSIVETAKANGLQPYEYLKLLFEELPKRKLSEIDDLLPWSEIAQTKCKAIKKQSQINN